MPDVFCTSKILLGSVSPIPTLPSPEIVCLIVPFVEKYNGLLPVFLNVILGVDDGKVLE